FPIFFFFSSRRRHTRFSRDWSSDVCSSDLSHARRLSLSDCYRWESDSHLATSSDGRVPVHRGAGQLLASGTAFAPLETSAERHFPADLSYIVHAASTISFCISQTYKADVFLSS